MAVAILLPESVNVNVLLVTNRSLVLHSHLHLSPSVQLVNLGPTAQKLAPHAHHALPEHTAMQLLNQLVKIVRQTLTLWRMPWGARSVLAQ